MFVIGLFLKQRQLEYMWTEGVGMGEQRRSWLEVCCIDMNGIIKFGEVLMENRIPVEIWLKLIAYWCLFSGFQHKCK